MKNLDKIARRKLADVLLEAQVLNREQLKSATDQTIATGKPLYEILITAGMITEDDVVGAISVVFQIPPLHIANCKVDKEVVSLFPAELLLRQQLIPFGRCGSIIMVLMSNILSYPVMNQIEEISQCELFLYVGFSSEIRAYLESNVKVVVAPAKTTSGMAWDTMFDLANDSIMGSTTTETQNPLDNWGV
ncbi:MAG: hypothetical protein AABZ60_21185 [Planctomycetota bacterium]